MKNLIKTFVVISLSCIASFACAQIQHFPVNFIIKRIVYNNDNDRMRMRLDLQVQAPSGIFEGPGVLSLCSCYCDSIWDAWPAPDGDIMGTGTMCLVSNSEGDIPQGPQNGVLGIQMVEGGIVRETEFNLSTKFILEEQ